MYRQWIGSLSQPHDSNGDPYPGALAYFYLNDATTPMSVFQDYDLTVSHPWPVVADGDGVFPLVFLNDTYGFFRQTVKTSGGVTLPKLTPGYSMPIASPQQTVIEEVVSDANALVRTGMVTWMPQSDKIDSYVRMNGRTMGSAGSGGTEYANAAAEALFLYAWNNVSDTICPVSGGRGGSAAADWSANKVITLLSGRGRALFGIDEMGNSAAGLLSGVSFDAGGGTNTPGASGGAARHTLATDEIPAHSHSANSVVTDPGHGHPGSTAPIQGGNQTTAGADSVKLTSGGTTGLTIANNTTGITVATTTSNTGGGSSHNNMPPFLLGTYYWKL